MVFALAGKAVRAVQITGVGHMQAQRLDHGATFFKVIGQIFEHIRRVQLAALFQCGNITDAVTQVLLCHVFAARILFQH
ncbi:hypothetical protein SDC9_175926 [bioreactor metagenome]|uniref:Uncharacterized protein n=1 Tax=bioreactor metagenome TaxID=1076179 RepID=A0A645GWT3_9ZZZZ